MPNFLNRIFGGASQKDTLSVNRFEGITPDGRVVLRDSRGTKKAAIPEVSEKGFTPGDPMAIYRPTGSKTISSAKAMAQFSGWTYAAVNAIAREVTGIELRLYRINGNKHQEIVDHELLSLLDGVNEHMTGPELKYITMAHLELTGNFYWLLDGVSDEMSPPRAIYPLNPGAMAVHLDKSSFPYKLSHYTFTVENKVYRFEPYQILHGKYPDPNDQFVGIGIPQTIPVWIDSDNYAMEYNRKFFINGASVGLYIQTDTNVEGNLDRIRQSYQNRQAGVENAHKTPVFPKGVKLEHTGVTQRDMDFAKLTDATRDRILAGFGVSKTILGTAESDTNRSTAETADYVFSKRTIKPKMTLLVSYINEYLTPRYGEDLYLTFVDPTPEDSAARTTEMTAAAGTGVPIMTQNEARKAYLGLGPIEGGDQLYKPSTLEPAGETPEEEGEDPTPELSTAKTVAGWTTSAIRIRTGGKTANSAGAVFRRALRKAFSDKIDKAVQYEVKNFSDLTHSEYMEHWKRFADRSGEAEAQLKDVFLGINRKQLAEVLDNLPEATGVKKALSDLFDLKDWIGITVDLATPILRNLAKDEATAALSMIGASYRDILLDKSTEEALQHGIAKMATSYNETTLKQLKEVLTEKMTQEGGTNLKELTDAVEGVYSYADERRAGLIAQTEAFRAANWANREAWVQSGVVKSLKWYTAEDDRVCKQCQDLDGETVGIEDKFFADTYSDGMTPPAHPDCRCYIRPQDISID